MAIHYMLSGIELFLSLSASFTKPYLVTEYQAIHTKCLGHCDKIVDHIHGRRLRAYPKIILLYIIMQHPKHTNAK